MSGANNYVRSGQTLQDHAYYTLNFRNSGVDGNAEYTPVDYVEVRNNPYLMEPDAYHLSVVRFSMSTNTLPILIPQMLLPLTAANVTVYTVTMQHPSLNGGVPFQQNVVYEPQTNLLSRPTVSSQNFQNPYYYIYQVQPFIDMVNTAISTCYTSLVGAAVPVESKNYAPYLVWNEAANIATFVARDSVFRTLGYANQPAPAAYDYGATPVNVWFNSALFQLFNSFAAIVTPFAYNTAAVNFGRDHQFQWYNTYNSTEAALNTFIQNQTTAVYGAGAAAGLYLKTIQSYSSVPSMNPVKALVFLTSLLPVNPENVSQPESVGGARGFSSNGNNSNISTVLTDFEVDLINGQEYRPTVLYTPTAEYRLVDLNSNQPLSSIQITVNWRNVLGDLVPLYLGSNGNAQIKIMFRRKDFNG
jgi:hypothetical protein